jgi:hypothetical protein
MARFRTSGAVVVAVATAGVFAAGFGTAVSAPHVRAPVAPTPTLKVNVAHGKFSVHGSRTFQAGRVNLSMTVEGKPVECAVARFAKGYGFKAYIKDFQTFAQGQGPNGESKAGLKALNHLAKRATFFGGLKVGHGRTARGSVVLPKAGTYYIYDDTLGKYPHKLTVTGPVAQRAVPDSSGTIKATSAKRFAGAKVLAARGIITYKNVSSGSNASPHFLVLQHVAKGTTRKDVEKAFMSNSNSQPPWVRKGSKEIDVISPGQSMTFNVNLPKGQYAELCFFPDLQTGIPHAFMGMIGIITLK